MVLGMSNDTVYFVWTLVNGHPWPAKWFSAMVNSATGKEYKPAQKHLLSEQERNMTFSELMEKYPYKGTKDV